MILDLDLLFLIILKKIKEDMSIFVGVVIDDLNTYSETFGEIKEEDLNTIKQFSSTLDFKCLIFVNPFDNTVFNKKQAYQLLAEVRIIKSNSLIENPMFSIMEKAVNKLLNAKEGLYLKFEGE